MHPQYKATRQHVCGGKAGALTLNSKGWFTSKDTLLHQGEGSITAIAWQQAFIAWANSMGVKVIDANTQQHITFIDRPNEDAVKTGACKCALLWSAPDTLIVAWGTLIKIARVRHRDAAAKADAAPSPLPNRYCEITAILQTDFILCGVAPLGKHLVALGWADDEADEDDEESDQEASSRPELHVLDMDSEARHWHSRTARALACVSLTPVQVLSVDALSLRGSSSLSAVDLQVRPRLACSRLHGTATCCVIVLPAYGNIFICSSALSRGRGVPVFCCSSCRHCSGQGEGQRRPYNVVAAAAACGGSYEICGGARVGAAVAHASEHR